MKWLRSRPRNMNELDEVARVGGGALEFEGAEEEGIGLEGGAGVNGVGVGVEASGSVVGRRKKAPVRTRRRGGGSGGAGAAGGTASVGGSGGAGLEGVGIAGYGVNGEVG